MRKLLSTAEAAAHLNLSASTLERYRRLRIGPSFIRVHRNRVRYEVEHLNAWMEERVVTPTEGTQ